MVAPSRSWGDKIGATGGNSGKGSAGGSKGRPGGVGTQRSVFTSQDGLSKGITVAVGPELQKKNAQRAATYNAAAHNWNQSAKQRSLGNLVNALSPMGFSMEPPDIARPATFSGSDYHLGWNPGSLAGFAGSLIAPGAGIPLGMAGQAIYTGLGGKNPIVSGPGNMGMPTWDAPGTGNPASPTGALTPGGGQLAGKTEGGSPMAAFGPQAPGGAPFGPEMQTGGNPNPMGAFFKPRLPNHSLPKNYPSMFPDSLSPEDLALLYGQALA